MQQFFDAKNKENIKGLHYWLFLREVTGFPSQRASDTGYLVLT